MVVDMLRSHHLGPARMVAGSGEVFWVRWYKAADTAKVLPFPSAFGSAVWITDFDSDAPPLGMQGPTPPGRDGKIPSIYEWAPSSYPAPPGLHWHGLPEWFLHGLPADKLVPDPGPADLCGRPLIDGTGRLTPGGKGSFTYRRRHLRLIIQKVTPDPIPDPTADNYPLGDGVSYRLSSAGPLQITGFGDGEDGRLVMVLNVGAFPIFLMHQDSGSLTENRFCAIDQVAIRVYPGYEAWLQYDGTSTCWREVQTVPLVSEKGDILTATADGPSVLRSSGIPGDVLTQAPSEPTGLLWASGAGGLLGRFDLNFWRQVRRDRSNLGERWYEATFDFGGNYGPAFAGNGVASCKAFISPRGGRLDKLRCNVISGATGAFCRLGIYRSASASDLYPGALVAGSDLLSLGASGHVDFDVDIPLSPNECYWLVFWATYPGSAPSVSGRTTPPITLWPMFGVDEDLNPGAKFTAWAGAIDASAGLPDPMDDGLLAEQDTLRPVVGVRYSE